MSKSDYRKMFEGLDAYKPVDQDLNNLALLMSGKTNFPDAHIFANITNFVSELFAPKIEPEPIPSGYTYLGQFIIHDISFDGRNNRHRKADQPFKEIMDEKSIEDLKNLRQPNFNLETVYGNILPTNQIADWSEPPRSELMSENSDLPLLKLGYTDDNNIDGGTASLSYPNDLPRKHNSLVANIVDPRNDENLLLAQTLVAFIKFHNAIVLTLNDLGKYEKEILFYKARKLAIRYYQTIVLEDYLPRVIQDWVLAEVRSKINTDELFYQPKPDNLYIPLEFSGAAFRFGHSMIRREYNFNNRQKTASLRNLMMFTEKGEMNGFSILRLPSLWIINWTSFYDIDGSKFNVETFNNAEPINTELPVELLSMRPEVDAENNPDGLASSIAALDLYRGRRLGLPTGQDIAQAIAKRTNKVLKLSAEQISDLIMRKTIAGTNPKPEKVKRFEEIKERSRDAFSRETPLWFYILAEAEIQNDGKLGSVGSWIVAETILQILYHSEYSILKTHEKLEPDEEAFVKSNKISNMPDMLKFVRKTNKKYFNDPYPNFDELNPLG